MFFSWLACAIRVAAVCKDEHIDTKRVVELLEVVEAEADVPSVFMEEDDESTVFKFITLENVATFRVKMADEPALQFDAVFAFNCDGEIVHVAFSR